MDNEEYVRAQQVIAESNTSLVVKALEESIEELRGEIHEIALKMATLKQNAENQTIDQSQGGCVR